MWPVPLNAYRENLGEIQATGFCPTTKLLGPLLWSDNSGTKRSALLAATVKNGIFAS